MAAREGYIHQNQTTTFIFDESIYHMSPPNKVMVTGTFCNWEINEKWHLKKASKSIWTLSIKNEDYQVIPPDSEFKFLINEGKWIHPPHDVQNQRRGNLVFIFDT
jgi:hypothetical protein